MTPTRRISRSAPARAAERRRRRDFDHSSGRARRESVKRESSEYLSAGARKNGDGRDGAEEAKATTSTRARVRRVIILHADAFPKHAPEKRRIARVTAERTTRRTHPRSRASPPPPPTWRWRRDRMRPRSLTPFPSPSPRNARRDLPRLPLPRRLPSRARARGRGAWRAAPLSDRRVPAPSPRRCARAPSRRHPPPRVPPRRVAPPPSPPTRPRPRPAGDITRGEETFEFIEALLRRARRLARPLDHDVRANFDVAAGVGDESQPGVRPAPLRVARHARVRHVPDLRRAPT